MPSSILRHVPILCFLALAPAAGLLGGAWSEMLGNVLFGLLLIVCSLVWCMKDSEARNVDSGDGCLLLGILFLWIVFMPAYLVKSYGWLSLLLFPASLMILLVGMVLYGTGFLIGQALVA